MWLEIECRQCGEEFKVDWPEKRKGKVYGKVSWTDSHGFSRIDAGTDEDIIIYCTKEEFPLRALIAHHDWTRIDMPEYHRFTQGHTDYRTKDGKNVDVSGKVCIIR
jgi:hypothetical protein